MCLWVNRKGKVLSCIGKRKGKGGGVLSRGERKRERGTFDWEEKLELGKAKKKI